MRKKGWNREYVEFLILQAEQRATSNRETRLVTDPDKAYWRACKPGRHKVSGDRKYIIREEEYD